MHLVIINGAARPQAKSNTAKIIAAFGQGYEECGNTTEVYYLSDRRQWAKAQKAFQENTSILIALPLYVENIPGILLEFLSGLQSKKTPGTNLAFLLQGVFPEASQSRCCEAFLETLPPQLGCEYAGTLIKGDMFGVGLVDEKNQEKMLAPFIEMGRLLPRAVSLKSPSWTPLPRQNLCQKSRCGHITCSVSIFPASSWGRLRKNWAVRKNWMPDRLKIEHIICKNPCK